jgi:hypothetical protein
MIYVDPTPGIGGIADLSAALYVDGEHLSEFGSLALVADGPASAPLRSKLA